jgi:ATP-dependent Clp protease ATP-binding subunit ClpA
MTRDRNFKKLVRARMHTTGESYTAALAHFQRAARREPPITAPPTPPTDPRRGGSRMYPFERFTERAKKVLTLAQQEAEAAHHSYIGTEHLLVAMLREGDGIAAHALSNLGVELQPVRDAIKNVLGRNERIIIQQIIPTSRVKKVIELSFEEARSMGHAYVGTEHMLLGLLIEGEGIAAHVLKDSFDVTVDRAREEIGRLLQSAGPEPASPQEPGAAPVTGAPFSPEVSALLRRARSAALAGEPPAVVGLQHLLAAMTGAAAFVALERLLDVHRARAVLEDAIRAQDYEKVAQLREAHGRADEALRLALDAWREDLK